MPTHPKSNLLTLREEEVGREKHRLIAPILAPTGDQTHNLSLCLDWESNPQPVGVRADAPTNRATEQGLK